MDDPITVTDDATGGASAPTARLARALERLMAGVRQARFPREFRIDPPHWSADWYDALVRVAERHAREDMPPEEPRRRLQDAALMADVLTGLWRAHRNLTEPGSDQPKDGMSRPLRHVRSVIDALDAEGFRIRDHTGESWTDGRKIHVVAFQPTPGLDGEVIIETIKPSVFFGESEIQEGQVIVGTPDEGGETTQPPTRDVAAND